MLRQKEMLRFLAQLAIASRASALGNQSAFWSRRLWFLPNQPFLGTAFVVFASFARSCFLHFLRYG